METDFAFAKNMTFQKRLQLFYWLKFGLYHEFKPVRAIEEIKYYWVADINGLARVFVDVNNDGQVTYTPELARPNSEQLAVELQSFIENGTPPIQARKPGGPRP